MTTITRTRPGHWASQHSDCKEGIDARFMGLTGDQRVSFAEQQDYFPDSGKLRVPAWLVVAGLVVFPLLTALVVHLVRLCLQS